MRLFAKDKYNVVKNKNKNFHIIDDVIEKHLPSSLIIHGVLQLITEQEQQEKEEQDKFSKEAKMKQEHQNQQKGGAIINNSSAAANTQLPEESEKTCSLLEPAGSSTEDGNRSKNPEDPSDDHHPSENFSNDNDENDDLNYNDEQEAVAAAVLFQEGLRAGIVDSTKKSASFCFEKSNLMDALMNLISSSPQSTYAKKTFHAKLSGNLNTKRNKRLKLLVFLEMVDLWLDTIEIFCTYRADKKMEKRTEEADNNKNINASSLSSSSSSFVPARLWNQICPNETPKHDFFVTRSFLVRLISTFLNPYGFQSREFAYEIQVDDQGRIFVDKGLDQELILPTAEGDPINQGYRFENHMLENTIGFQSVNLLSSLQFKESRLTVLYAAVPDFLDPEAPNEIWDAYHNVQEPFFQDLFVEPEGYAEGYDEYELGCQVSSPRSMEGKNILKLKVTTTEEEKKVEKEEKVLTTKARKKPDFTMTKSSAHTGDGEGPERYFLHHCDNPQAKSQLLQGKHFAELKKTTCLEGTVGASQKKLKWAMQSLLGGCKKVYVGAQSLKKVSPTYDELSLPQQAVQKVMIQSFQIFEVDKDDDDDKDESGKDDDVDKDDDDDDVDKDDRYYDSGKENKTSYDKDEDDDDRAVGVSSSLLIPKNSKQIKRRLFRGLEKILNFVKKEVTDQKKLEKLGGKASKWMLNCSRNKKGGQWPLRKDGSTKENPVKLKLTLLQVGSQTDNNVLDPRIQEAFLP